MMIFCIFTIFSVLHTCLFVISISSILFKTSVKGYHLVSLKVHLTPKYLVLSNKSLHPFLNGSCHFAKSGHHLSHSRASKGYGSIPGLASQTSLHACLQRLNTMQISLCHQTRNRPTPLTSSVLWQMMARFRNFYNLDTV